MRFGLWLTLGSLALLSLWACGSDDSNSSGAAGSAGAAGAAGSAGFAGSAGSAGSEPDGGVAGAAGSSVDPTPVALVQQLAYPYRVVVDDSHAYVSCAGTYDGGLKYDGPVLRVPKAGGASETLSEEGMFTGLAIDGANVYASADSPTQKGLWVYSKSSGQTRLFPTDNLATFLAPAVASAGQSASAIYYPLSDKILKLSVEDGQTLGQQPAILSSIASLAFNGTHLVWSEDEWDSSGTPKDQGALFSLNLDEGRQAETLLTFAGAPNGLALDSSDAYLVDMRGGDIWKVALDGSLKSKIATGQAAPNMIAVDESFVYWTNRGSPFWSAESCANKGSVMKVAKSGGTPVAIASGASCSSGIALDSQYVYWVNAGTNPHSTTKDGSLWRAGK